MALPLLPISPERPKSWRWQLQNTVRTVDALARAIELTPEELEGARRAERAGLPIAVTPYYLALCDPHDASCPIRRQVRPSRADARIVS